MQTPYLSAPASLDSVAPEIDEGGKMKLVPIAVGLAVAVGEVLEIGL